mmetsp:Transcript_42313/g.99247  ORF Transcript_42313/g.99247 Transcript_42313/m.99247 type:complete len:430 (-) Transcript_42313:2872-4161(-)
MRCCGRTSCWRWASRRCSSCWRCSATRRCGWRCLPTWVRACSSCSTACGCCGAETTAAARRRPRVNAINPSGQREPLPRGRVFAFQTGNEIGRGQHLANRADALSAAPDVLPGLGRAAAEVHLARVALGQMVRVQAGRHHRAAQVVAMHAGEQVAVDDVVAVAVDDHLLVLGARAGLVGGDEGRADVGQVGPHGLGGQDGIAGGDGARQRQRAVEPFADLLDQRERALHAGMAACTGGHGDQAVGALLDGLLRELVVDDVVQHDAAPAMHRLVDVLTRTEARDDDRHLVFGADLHVVLQPLIALVHDLVDRKRRRRPVRVGLVVGGQGLGDLGQPFVEQLGRARIERRHRSDDAGLALLDDELGVADDEQRRADGGQRQVLQDVGQGQGDVSVRKLRGSVRSRCRRRQRSLRAARPCGAGCARRRSAPS